MFFKLNFKKIVLWLLVLLWMSVIFSFSAQKAVESQGESDGIVEKIVAVFIKDYNSMSDSQKLEITGTLSTVTRKGAHMTEYFILGVLIYSAFNLYKIRKSRKIIISLLLSLLYSVSDEIHQNFVSGRACRFTDVLIDFSGILFGVLLFSIIYSKIKTAE